MEDTIQIRNKKTGEVKTISKGEASKYGIQQTPQEEGFDLTNLLPLGGSIAGGIAGSALAPGVGSVAGYAGGGAAGEALRQKIKGEEFNPGQIGLQGAMGAIPFGLGKVLGKLLPFLKLGPSALTKGGLAKKTTNIAAKASKAGATVPVETVSKDITETATKKLGNFPDVQKALNELMKGIRPKTQGTTLNTLNPENFPRLPITPTEQSSITPRLSKLIRDLRTTKNPSYKEVYTKQSNNLTAQSPTYYNKQPLLDIGGLEAQGSFSPTQLLNLRRQLLAREGTGLLDKLFKGSDISSKVSNVGRGVLSSTLHELTPETIPPDKLFTLYSKLGGDVPALVLKGGGVTGALALLKHLFSSVASGGENARGY